MTEGTPMGKQGGALVFVLRHPRPVPTFVLNALDVLVSQFEETHLVVRPETLEAARSSLSSRDLPGKVQTVAFKDVDHAGATLALAGKLARKHAEVTALDDSLVGPTEGSTDLARVCALPGPIKTLIPFESASHPLNLEGGLLAADVAWLTTAPVVKRLRSRSARTWQGLGWALEALNKGVVPSVYEDSDAGTPWLQSGLKDAIEAGIGFVPWQILSADPLELGALGLDSRKAFSHLTGRGVSSRVIWDHLLKTVQPQVWHANLRLLTITDPGRPSSTPIPKEPPNSSGEPLTTAVIMHVFYPDMLEDMVRLATNVPGPAALFITTDTETKASDMAGYLASQDHFDHVEVRVVKSNQGRDIPAFLIDCADVLMNEKFDLIVKLHSKKSAQIPQVVGTYFKDQLFLNLVGTPQQGRQIKALFEEEPQLGLVFPPMIHMGHPTMGNGWMTNKLPAFSVARRLGFELEDAHFPSVAAPGYRGLPRFPADRSTPLAPYGSMFWARRKGLEPLVNAGFSYEEFPSNDAYLDGSLAHILERLTAYTVYSQGFYARTVQTLENAEFSDGVLQAKLSAFDRTLPLSAPEQVAVVKGTQQFRWERLVVQVYSSLVRISPPAAQFGRKVWKGTKATKNRLLGRASASS